MLLHLKSKSIVISMLTGCLFQFGFTSLLGITLFLSCQSPQKADLILINGKVFTYTWDDPAGDGSPAANAPYVDGVLQPDAEAVAIRDSKIIFVGSAAKALTLKSENTEIVDVGGGTILPGLVDSHTHVAELGAKLTRVDLTDVESEQQAVALVAGHAKSVPAGDWIIAQGWDEGAWAQNYPDKNLLTEKVPRHPVLMRSLHGFAVWCNQMALDRAGIDSNTETPVGGEIHKNAAGQPNGLFLNRATTLLDAAVPPPTQAQIKQMLLAGLKEMARSGYAAVHEAGVDSQHLAAYQALQDEGKLPIRVYVMLSARDESLIREWTTRGPWRSDDNMLFVQSVKAYYDGALGSRGARLLEPYSDQPGHFGVSGDGYGFDQDLVADIMQAGFQVGIHAIGDAGNRETLDFFEKALSRHPKLQQNRHRIEHAQVVHPTDFSRFRQMEIIASMEPPHAVEDKSWAEERLGPQRIKGAYAWRTFREAGVPLIFNSDLSGSDHNIFYGLNSAITRRDKNLQPPAGWYPGQTMTPEEAVRGYSSWAAYASFLENETGTIEIGKWADLTVLDLDPHETGVHAPDDLLNGNAILTIVSGKIVYGE